jgi:uncharacterized protein
MRPEFHRAGTGDAPVETPGSAGEPAVEIPVCAAGIGLRQPHHAAVAAARPEVGFLEIHAENFMGGGGQIRFLENTRKCAPISVHGVGLGLGGAQDLDRLHLDRLAALVERIDPLLVSEHVAWCGLPDVFLNDLLPPLYNEAGLAILVAHIGAVQDRLKRRILIENPSTYLTYAASDMAEGDYLAEAARRSGCGLLLDVNNLYVNQRNHGSDPLAVIDRLPVAAVGEIHLAGHHVADLGDATLLIDNHGAPVAAAVWDLYEAAVRRFPAALTLVEWDSDIPALEVLVGEAHRADARRRRAIEEARHAPAG